MNKIILIFVVFFFAACGAGDLASGSGEHLGRVGALQQQPLTTCTARVFCPQNGKIAQCAVYANPYYGQRCTWEAYPAYGVRCRGWDAFGHWVVYEDYCNLW